MLIWLGVVGASIWRFASQDATEVADTIIVLGASVIADKPSPVFEERIKHGINLYRNGLSKKIIFTGGFGSGKRYSESYVGASMAINQGVPAQDILIEESSRTTQQNLYYAHKLMQENNLNSAIIVSDPLHMKRAIMVAEDLDIDAFSSPTPTTRYKGLKVRLSFLVREIYFIHHYFVTGD
jgi:uncharacterized SAM-binding protein YcdF (DUF218 family)